MIALILIAVILVSIAIAKMIVFPIFNAVLTLTEKKPKYVYVNGRTYGG